MEYPLLVEITVDNVPHESNLVHSEPPKVYRVLAVLSSIGLTQGGTLKETLLNRVDPQMQLQISFCTVLSLILDFYCEKLLKKNIKLTPSPSFNVEGEVCKEINRSNN